MEDMQKTSVTDAMLNDDVLQTAVSYLRRADAAADTDTRSPNPESVVQTLLAMEKASRKEKTTYQYEQLVGVWRLGFVSGTQKVRPRPNVTPVKRPAKGRFLPQWITVKITYSQGREGFGSVANAVALGPAKLTLSGPTRFWPKTNTLGFDFVHLQGRMAGLTLYDGSVRGGDKSLQSFKSKTLKDQAFFTFFAIAADYIAARGKGGGLALWVRSGQ